MEARPVPSVDLDISSPAGTARPHPDLSIMSALDLSMVPDSAQHLRWTVDGTPLPAADARLSVTPEQAGRVKHVRFNPAITVKQTSAPVTPQKPEAVEVVVDSRPPVSVVELPDFEQHAGDEDRLLGKPEFHSTLRLQRHMAALSLASMLTEPLPPPAVEVTSAALNVPYEERLFKDLVNVEPCEEEVLERAKRRAARAVRKTAPKLPAKSAEKTSELPEPDLLEFFNHEDMVSQFLDCSLPGLPELTPGLKPADEFLLNMGYTQLRNWQLLDKH